MSVVSLTCVYENFVGKELELIFIMQVQIIMDILISYAIAKIENLFAFVLHRNRRNLRLFGWECDVSCNPCLRSMGNILLVRFVWWRHQMEIFSALLAFCAGNSPINGEFPAQRPVTRSFDFFFDLCLIKRLSKQLWGWWSETSSRSLRRHCNGILA